MIVPVKKALASWSMQMHWIKNELSFAVRLQRSITFLSFLLFFDFLIAIKLSYFL